MENGKIIESAASMCLSMKPGSYLILQTSYWHDINSVLTPIGELAYHGNCSRLISNAFQFFISKVGRFSFPKLANYFISFQRKSISLVIFVPVAQAQGVCDLVVNITPLRVFHSGAAFPLQVDPMHH